MIRKLLSNAPLVFTGIILVSFMALGMAFFSEAILKLEPCILCIYQRYPFAIAIILGIIGLVLKRRIIAVRITLGLISLNFLVNSMIAYYHTGVEQGWWVSAVEGCSMPLFEKDSGKSILENLMSAPMGDCSKIPWQDPIFGLSMANYNIPFCFGLFLLCALSAALVRTKD